MNNEIEMDLFPEEPKLDNFGITGIKLKGAQLQLIIDCVTNVNDVAVLEDAWKLGVAEWLLTICRGNTDEAAMAIRDARINLENNIDD